MAAQTRVSLRHRPRKGAPTGGVRLIICFSNLPVEFDEQGNPYLTDEADDVKQPERIPGDELSLDDDPEEAYAEIVAGVPQSVRESLGDGHGHVEAERDDERESARSD